MSKVRVTVYSRRSSKAIKRVTVSNMTEAEQSAKEFPGNPCEQTRVVQDAWNRRRIDVRWPDGESYQYGIAEIIPDHQS